MKCTIDSKAPCNFTATPIHRVCIDSAQIVPSTFTGAWPTPESSGSARALSLGTRIMVLAKESMDQGSRVMLDVPVPQPCHDDETPHLVLRLESPRSLTSRVGREKVSTISTF